ncbi:hypothetical protein [Pelagibius sp.]|uniref:hypothetical protein n=1 Tax=Pelagibius sp. TaxID=1931238 RepID=UPI003BB1F448
MSDDFLAALKAERKIQRVFSRYIRGCDRRDYDLVWEARHDDAYDDHGPYKGEPEG